MAMLAKLVWDRFENFKLATKMLSLALEAQRNLTGDISPNTCDIEMEVANLLSDVKRYDSAWKIYNQVLEKLKQIYGEVHPKIASTYEMMGHVLNHRKDYDAAEKTYTKALKILIAVYNRPHYKTANAIHDLASIQQYKGNYIEAAKLYKEAINMWHQTLGNLSSEVTVGYKMLAFNYIDTEKWDEAWESLISCLIRCERIYGTKHSEYTGIVDSLERVWNILNNKGLVTDKQRKDYEILHSRQ
jgi:tetratricopeptide (TPR) repeat protein